MSWRSEANCVYLVLWLGDRKDRRGFDDGFGFRHLFRHFGARLALCAAKLGESAEVRALGSANTAVDAIESTVFKGGLKASHSHGGAQELSFGTGETALVPLGVNHGFDEEALKRTVGL